MGRVNGGSGIDAFRVLGPLWYLLEGVALGWMTGWLPGAERGWMPWAGVAIFVVLTPWQVWGLMRVEEERRRRVGVGDSGEGGSSA